MVKLLNIAKCCSHLKLAGVPFAFSSPLGQLQDFAIDCPASRQSTTILPFMRPSSLSLSVSVSPGVNSTPMTTVPQTSTTSYSKTHNKLNPRALLYYWSMKRIVDKE